ncbi:hypothetical protein [Cellulomonas sp. URHD0024]|uniref:hypothetical protein n=1 Tax=Cellulomonas sp. URHD0024 TaxID=1302620 RepID=UPI00040BE163|nr:hypothetical protein [Cellulomonas sp. URHD0024]
MSTTFENDLRRQAEASVPAGLSLDVSTVLAAGRRRRSGHIAGALGAVGVLVLGGAIVANLGLTSPTLPAGRPGVLADATAVEVAPGVLAADKLVPQLTPDGTIWWDTGLETHPLEGYRYGFAAATNDELRAGGGSSSVLAGVSLGLYKTTTTPLTASQRAISPDASDELGSTGDVWKDVISWPRASSSADPARPLTSLSGFGENGSTVYVLAGHVSARVPSARAAMIVASGLANGRSYVELPTVVSPVDPKARLYAVTIDEAKLRPNRAYEFRPVIVFVGSDGTVDLNDECGGSTIEECSQTLGGALVPALKSIGAHLPD